MEYFILLIGDFSEVHVTLSKCKSHYRPLLGPGWGESLKDGGRQPKSNKSEENFILKTRIQGEKS